MNTTLEVARAFVQAVQLRNADAAAELCADGVEVILPGIPVPFQGKDGVRQMVRMVPAELVQSYRDEVATGDDVRITTLTRAPGIFANYTTWHFELEERHIRRLTFELRAAN